MLDTLDECGVFFPTAKWGDYIIKKHSLALVLYLCLNKTNICFPLVCYLFGLVGS